MTYWLITATSSRETELSKKPSGCIRVSSDSFTGKATAYKSSTSHLRFEVAKKSDRRWSKKVTLSQVEKTFSLGLTSSSSSRRSLEKAKKLTENESAWYREIFKRGKLNFGLK